MPELRLVAQPWTPEQRKQLALFAAEANQTLALLSELYRISAVRDF